MVTHVILSLPHDKYSHSGHIQMSPDQTLKVYKISSKFANKFCPPPIPVKALWL